MQLESATAEPPTEDPSRPFPALECDRLVLRAFVEDDAAAVFEIFAHRDVARFHNIVRMRSLSEAKRVVARRRAAWSQGTGIHWAIARRQAPGHVLGSCGLHFGRGHHGAVELNYDLHPDHWGRGYAREAVRGVVTCAFGGSLLLQVHRVEALTLPDNHSSRALLSALGFADEGMLRAYRNWQGLPADLQSYSLLIGDWSRTMEGDSSVACTLDSDAAMAAA